jgi:hypothetical protein
VVVGQTSSVATVTVTNSGTADLNVTSIHLAAPFSVVSETCTANPVASSGTCNILVRFTPTQTGLVIGAITITDDASDSPQSIPLSGTALKPPPVISGISPDHGSASGGTTVTIEGDDFIPDATQVTIGGVVVPPTGVVIAGDPTATFTTPPHAPGAVPVVISTPDGTSSAITFTYDAVPAPTPPVGPTASGSSTAASTTGSPGTGPGIGGAPATTAARGTSLAFTGAELGGLVGGGFALLLVGGLLLLVRRRVT